MDKNSISTFCNDNQYFSAIQDGSKNMAKRILSNFINSLIRENAKHNDDSYSLFVSDLEPIDKKIFLSHLVSADEFEDYSANETRMSAAIKEYEEEMQFFVNENIDQVYHEDMRELGLTMSSIYSDDTNSSVKGW
jgi:hypothetical protein